MPEIEEWEAILRIIEQLKAIKHQLWQGGASHIPDYDTKHKLGEVIKELTLSAKMHREEWE